MRIDRDLVVKFAQQAKAAAIPHFSVLTSIGANSNSFFLYTKTKGQVYLLIMYRLFSMFNAIICIHYYDELVSLSLWCRLKMLYVG